MSAAAWIAIAAIIIASINSWGQFWLKQRSETKKALADASPATNQPNPVGQLGFWESIKTCVGLHIALVGNELHSRVSSNLAIS